MDKLSWAFVEMTFLLRSPALLSGLVLVALSWINFFVTRSMGPAVGQIGGTLAIFVMIPFILWAQGQLRGRLSAPMTFWEAFFEGAKIVMVSAGCMFVSTVLFMLVNRRSFEKWSAGDVELDSVQEVPVMNTFEQAFIMFLIVLMLGSIFSLVTSIFVRKSA